MQECLIKNRGFTLIELMVTISVIVIISAAVFADFSSSEERLTLKRASYQVAQDLRETEEMALSSVSGQICEPKAVCGFGLNFNKQSSPNSYLIFADCDNNCSVGHNYTKDGNDKTIKTIFLEKNIEIESLLPLLGNDLDIVFTAPDPAVWINNIKWQEEARIVLKSTQNETRAAKVNSTGRIEIE